MTLSKTAAQHLASKRVMMYRQGRGWVAHHERPYYAARALAREVRERMVAELVTPTDDPGDTGAPTEDEGAE